MSEHAPPSGDPADDDSLAGLLRGSFKKFLQQTDDMLPAVVIAFDRVKNRATVSPCVTALTTDGRAIPRAQVASVPVVQVGGGGVVLNFNLKAGDFGWIKANDRDISTFLQGYKTSPPNTLRLHTFQDAVFIPDVMRGWAIAGEDADNAVLQTLDGNAKVAVGASHVKLAFGGAALTLDAGGIAAVFGGHSVTIGAAGVTIVGPTNASGGFTGTGGMTLSGGMSVDGLDFGSHVHTDPQGGNVGVPHA